VHTSRRLLALGLTIPLVAAVASLLGDPVVAQAPTTSSGVTYDAKLLAGMRWRRSARTAEVARKPLRASSANPMCST